MTQIVPVSRTSTTNRGSQKVNVWLKTKERMNLVANGDFIVSGENGLLPNICLLYTSPSPRDRG